MPRLTKLERDQKQQAHDLWVHDRAFRMGKTQAENEAASNIRTAHIKAKIDLAHQFNGLVESVARAIIALTGSLDK